MSPRRGYRESLARAGKSAAIRAARKRIYAKLAGKPVRRSKFGAIKTCYDGATYASKLEAAHAQRLDLLKKSAANGNRVKSWKRQVPIRLVVNGSVICTYIVDFVVAYEDGREELHEVKGVWTPEAKLKVKLFRALFPDRRLVVVMKS
jgi:hypothetical protein